MSKNPAPILPLSNGDHQKILRSFLLRFLQTRGPVTITEILQRYPLNHGEVETVLSELAQSGAVYRGRLTRDASEEQWCDRRNFEQLYRRAIQEHRRALAPVSTENFLHFLWRWHQIGQLQNSAQLLPLLQRLRGLYLPIHFLEREILRARLLNKQFTQLFATCHLQLASLCQQGELIWRLYQEDKGHAKLVQFFLRGEGHIFYTREQLKEKTALLSAPAQKVRDFLREHGASFFRDLAAGISLPKPQLIDGLAELAWNGLVTNDSLHTLYELAEHGAPRPAETELSGAESPAAPQAASDDLQQFLETKLPEWRKRDHALRRRRYARRREEFRRESRNAEMPQLTEGRWSLVESFAIYGKPIVENDVHTSDGRSLAHRQAHLLLERYGILVKEWYRREVGLLPWYALFQALKRMEWRGEVRRGYFVEGLSGVQFALPHAAEMLAAGVSSETFSSPVMLNLLDPAVPYGSGVNLPLLDANNKPLPIVRQAGNHLLFVNAKPVVYAENFGTRLWRLAGTTEEQLTAALACLRQFLLLPEPFRPRKRLDVESWNGAPVTATSAAAWLAQSGFEKEGEKMVLWPSRL